ncbi:transaldolase [uncultured Thiohalocapsa sp.]|uniref:transaldolase n=1 Tax=uncultured Thiohalocapsa sp. TaxID=768990 RepID=UPI0025E67A04|nr:transaldolase [uncultured Thiohalocapsa sp.]
MNKLEALRDITPVVADTGDIASIESYRPVDATTNPSLLLKAARLPQYQPLVDEAVDYGKRRSDNRAEQSRLMMDKLAVSVGVRILDLVPGRVSTEVDARLSFDTEATITRARQIMGLYDAVGIDKDRILIKIAATWEGIRAAELLEREGIHCNLTLMFGFSQAVACGEAGVTLISPFVGRIFDWYKAKDGVNGYAPDDDPGVRSVRRIYDYYKRHGYETTVMGASFRNTDQILALAGCDLLTIAPSLMDELAEAKGEVPRRLDPQDAAEQGETRVSFNESGFRWELNDDAMATEKLAEGIRNFAADSVRLERFAFESCTHCN